MRRLSQWDLHRTVAGAPAAEDIDVRNAAIYPEVAPAAIVDIDGQRFEMALLYWEATGANLTTDTVTFEPLMWDGSNSRWTRAARFTLPAMTAGTFEILHHPKVRMRIHAVAFAGAVTNLRVYSTGGIEAR